MPALLLDSRRVQSLLRTLSYWDAPLGGGKLTDAPWRAALRRLQGDTGLTTDGAYGPRTDRVARGLIARLAHAPAALLQLRRWRLTHYHLADEARYPGARTVPVYGPDRQLLARVTARMFAAMSLEGTGRMKDGRLLNVTGQRVAVKASDYASVLAVARSFGWIPGKPGYAGIVLDGAGTSVAAAMSFAKVSAKKLGEGYGTLRGVPLRPFRTLAADIGYPKYKNVDPRWKGKGGVCPPGTEVFILSFAGCALPDGTTHDGWFVVNDTGGGIYGAHFDVFTGTAELAAAVAYPRVGHIWFSGIEAKLAASYSHGL